MKDYTDVAELLGKLGWSSPCDAQWTNLKQALPALNELIAKALRPKVFVWLHDTTQDEVCAWQLNGDEEPEQVIEWTKRGYRDPKQAVREELVKKRLLSAPTKSASGGQHYDDKEARLYQL